MEKFCAKCGTTKGTILRGLCEKHYQEKRKVVRVPEKIVVQLEKETGKMRYRGAWVELTRRRLEEIVLSKLKIVDLMDPHIEITEEPDEAEFGIIVSGTIDNEPFSVHTTVCVVFEFVQSDAEMRLKSQYHEAILQLRFSKKPTQKQKELIEKDAVCLLAREKRRDVLSGISDRKERKEGIDLYVGSKHAAKVVAQKIAQKNKATITKSFKIVGKEKSGKDKVRTTYCVRIDNSC